jgi:hypothetical protein
LELAEQAVVVGHDDPQVMAIAALVLINIGHEAQRGLAMLEDPRALGRQYGPRPW